MDEDFDTSYVAVSITKKQNQRFIGASIHRRLIQNKEKSYVIELIDFIDNEQYSNLDTLFIQIGKCVLYLSDEYEDAAKGDAKKIKSHIEGKDIDIVYVKKSLYTKKPDTINKLLKLCGNSSHSLNIVETEREYSFQTIELLINSLHLLDNEDNYGKYNILLITLNNYMRLDTSAANAINLLPKPDQPNQFGSVYGVLNHCKTKMGSRLLESWLRQPLVNDIEINKRLDIVEIFKLFTTLRNQLCEEGLKSVPDLDTVIAK